MAKNNTFREWLALQTDRKDSTGDIARDITGDISAVGTTPAALRRYPRRYDVDARVLDAFDRATREYTRAMNT